jgi:arylsulfatase A-like enzyme
VKARRAIVAATTALVAVGVAAVALFELLIPGEEPTRRRPEAVAPRQPDVVFIVLDMVRADRLSLCGYAKPTSPRLEALARVPGTASTCRAYAPGTWTLPSHASFFTGEEVPVHGADFMLRAAGKESIPLWGEPVRPLAPRFETLAETFRKRGYATALVSGNPVVGERSATGLARGFDVVRDTDRFGSLYGDDLVRAVGEALDEASTAKPGRPRFLFVNISDAHHPWLPIPEGFGWLPPRTGLDSRPRLSETPYPRFLRGQLGAEERAALLEHVSDSYDYAVYRADRTLGAALDLMKRRGRFGGAHRLVVTSDHGELLGEHELLGHGTFVYEGIARVPLLYRASEGAVRIDASAPIAALSAYDLASKGALPARPRPVRSAGFPDGLLTELFGERFSRANAALWSGDEKVTWSEGDYGAFDLAADPDEAQPRPLPADHPRRAALDGFVAQMRETAEREAEPSKEMVEALRALGYVR